jgi:hypothetical protein
MRRIQFTKHWQVIILIGVVLMLLVSYSVYRLSKRTEAQVLEQKIVRETTATVKGKDYVRFDEANHSYWHEDGYRVERRPGDEEWRIYYQIDSFDQIAEPVRSRLLDLEMDRVTRGNLRYSIMGKEQYERIEVGDKLNIGWQWFGDDKIQIVTAGKPLPPNPQ